MRRSEVSRAVAVRLKISRRFAEEVTGAVIDVICDTLERGEPVDLTGFGRFEIRTWHARTNCLLGGGTKKLPERRFVKFRVSDVLKRRVRLTTSPPPKRLWPPRRRKGAKGTKRNG